MSISKDEILKISNLSKLDISSNLEDITYDINAILNMFEEMKNIDTSHVEILSHPLDITQRLRDDTVSEKNNREEYQKTASLIKDGFYIVPKVIE